MLLALDIKGFALIDKLYIEFENGLNIITGETGAGKSIVVDSINFVLGLKFSKDIVKKGMEKAEVNAVFDLSDSQIQFVKSMGFECNESTVNVFRSINLSSKSICRFNGKIITLSNLRQLSSAFMEVHGQHENQALFNEATHIDFLDSFVFKDDCSCKNNFNKEFADFRDFRNKIIDDKMDGKTINSHLNIIKEQLKEFEILRWQEGEEQQLKEQAKAMENMEAVTNSLNVSYNLLYGSENCVYEQLEQVMGALENIKDLNDTYKQLSERISSLYYDLEDIVEGVRREKNSFDFTPEKLEEIQKRLFEFSRLKKKYAKSEKEILEHFKKLKEEENELEYKLSNAKELREKLKELYKAAVVSAKTLSAIRKKGAIPLENEIVKHLNDLGMKNANFKVGFEDKDLNSKGIDAVEFLFCANKGQDLKPLNKVASGGEISRLMLALKNVDLNSSLADAMVFDEIDTGISGKMAQAVAVKLANIAGKNQVICVTHLPQVAAMGDVNIFISKTEKDLDTVIKAERLNGEGKVSEVARLISGSDISKSGIMHANQLIDESKEFKKDS